MKRCTLLLILLLALCIAGSAQARDKYNLWAKERIRYLRTKVDLDPRNAQLHVLLANAYYEDRQSYKAMKHLKKALELQPDFAEAHCNMAVILHAQGRLHDARREYEEALQRDSTLVEARAGLGALLCRTDQETTGLKYLKQVLQQDPRRTSARYNMAVAYHKLGDFKKAIQELEEVRHNDTNYPGLKQALGRAYYSQGLVYLQAEQSGPAIEVFQQALQHLKYNANLFYAKGLAHIKRKELDLAEAAFKEAVELEMDHVPALHNLASICDQTGRLQEAISYYKQVQNLTPHLGTIDAVRHTTYDVEYLMK